MNYRLRDNSVERRTYRLRAVLLAALSASLGVALAYMPGISSRVPHSVALPFWKGGAAAADGAGVARGLVMSKRMLIDENRRLKNELADVRAELMATEGMQAENAELRTLLSIPQGRDFTFAAVLAKPPVSAYDSLVLDGGEGIGLKPGDLVYAGESIILGEITEVHPKTAIAKLYSTAGTEFDTMIERTNVSHKAQGAGAGNFELRMPKDMDVIEGDILIVPGTHKKILGTVRRIESRQTDSFQRIFVKTPVNIFQLKWVGIERI